MAVSADKKSHEKHIVQNENRKSKLGVEGNRKKVSESGENEENRKNVFKNEAHPYFNIVSVSDEHVYKIKSHT